MKELSSIKRFLIICILTLVCILSITTSIFAVSEAAVLFLRISPSPLANGMGETYGNIASNDPMASIFNPAYLGFFSKKQNIGFSYSKVNWLPGLTSDLYYKSFSFNFGFSLKNKPITVGIGYHHIYLDLGKQIGMDEMGNPTGSFESSENANMFTCSALLDYYILASIGFSYKFIESNLSPSGTGAEIGSGEASANALDLGLSIKVPLFDILSKINNSPIYVIPNVKPFFEPSFSYSVTNIGDEIKYFNEAQADPLPRTVYTGINLNTGLKYSNMNYNFTVFSFKWAREANDLLIDKYFDDDGVEHTKYPSGFKDIDFIKNVIYGKSNDKIITNKGWEIGFGEIFYLRKGNYEDIEGKVKFDTHGWSINFIEPIRQFIEISNLEITNELLLKLLFNLDIEFHHSKFQTGTGHPLANTKFNGLTLKLKNIFIF